MFNGSHSGTGHADVSPITESPPGCATKAGSLLIHFSVASSAHANFILFFHIRIKTHHLVFCKRLWGRSACIDNDSGLGQRKTDV